MSAFQIKHFTLFNHFNRLYLRLPSLCWHTSLEYKYVTILACLVRYLFSLNFNWIFRVTYQYRNGVVMLHQQKGMFKMSTFHYISFLFRKDFLTHSLSLGHLHKVSHHTNISGYHRGVICVIFLGRLSTWTSKNNVNMLHNCTSSIFVQSMTTEPRPRAWSP